MASANATSYRCRSHFTSLGAATAVALSFGVFGLFVRRVPAPRLAAHVDLLATTPVGSVIGHPALALTVRLTALVLFVVTVLAGLFGDQNPYRQHRTHASVDHLLGWASLCRGFHRRHLGPHQSMAHRVRRCAMALGGWVHAQSLASAMAYPRPLATWPACLLLLAFSWTELVYPNAASPAHIAWLMIAYSIVTWAGMLAFGRGRVLATTRRGNSPSFSERLPALPRPKRGRAGCC
jgi:hypothetical protein